jgi:hypothetical protein
VLVITLHLVLAGNADEAMARPTFVPGFVLGGFLLFALCSLIWLVAS